MSAHDSPTVPAHPAQEAPPEVRCDTRARVRYWGRVLLINCLATIVVAAADGAFSGRMPLRAFARTLAAAFIFANSIGGLCGLLMPWVAPRVRAVRFPINWIAVVGVLLVINGAGCLLAALILIALGMAGPLERLPAEFWGLYKFGVFFTLVFGIGGTLYQVIHSELERTTQALHTKQLEEERARQLATEARLSSLESRVRPHFLFNTLNSISELVHDDPEEAERLIERLAALLRSSLDATGLRTISLSEELRLVRNYLEIEKARFGDRVRYAIDLPESLELLEVPPFTIQPLVENAIKHAVVPRPDGGSVWIQATRNDHTLLIAVSDDGPGFEGEASVPGHGLHTLRARLEALYGGAAKLRVQRTNGRTTVHVSIPLQTEVP